MSKTDKGDIAALIAALTAARDEGIRTLAEKEAQGWKVNDANGDLSFTTDAITQITPLAQGGLIIEFYHDPRFTIAAPDWWALNMAEHSTILLWLSKRIAVLSQSQKNN